MFRYHLLSEEKTWPMMATSIDVDYAILAEWPAATRDLLRQCGPDVFVHEVKVGEEVVAHVVCVRLKQ